MTSRRRPRDDRGSVSVELVVLTPAFALMLALVVLAGRVQSSRADIEAAAHSAARSITLARDPTSAIAEAHAATVDRLRVGSPSCRTLDWDVRIEPTEVTVDLACEVDLSEAAMLPAPGRFVVTASSTEVLDRFREDSGEFGISEGPPAAAPEIEVR
jgi:Flp pilus assembly protein TadG